MKPMWRWAASAALASLFLTAACGGGANVKRGGLESPPANGQGYPRANLVGDVYMEVTYTPKHTELFDQDLLRKGVLPIEFKLGLRKTEDVSEHLRIDPSNTGLRLYLSDGTVLEALTPAEVKSKFGSDRLKKRIDRSALDLSILRDWTEDSTFVFFDTRSLKDARIKNSTLTFVKNRQPVAVNLTNALLGFNLSVEERLRPIYAGIGYK